jgi:hypothetical protein
LLCVDFFIVTCQRKDTTMKTETHYPALVHENRTVIDTNAAAFHLNRRPQTLRKWACFENGVLRPIRINGRLAWRVADIRAIVNGQVL